MKTTTQGRAEGSKEFEFTARDFERVRALIHKKAGIALAESKQEMVYSRLARRLRATGIASFVSYLDQLEQGGSDEEWEAFTNALTTNLTSFFREAHHFPILADHIKKIKEPIEIWCSAASTDIDTNVLNTGANGVYSIDRLDKMAPERAKRFFLRGKGAREGMVRVRPELRQLITFKQVNLLESNWGISGQFDAIFCRNVMIYFDKPTQGKILDRFAPLMKPDGLLFAGHSENFLYVTDAFKLRGKTVYELEPNKKAGLSQSRRA
jgi:chemotaxis protein methyltransferase CheR